MRRRSGCLRLLLLLLLLFLGGRRLLGQRFAFVADEADRLTYFDLAFRDGDLQEHAARLGLDLLRHLVRVELVERFALLDLLAFGLEPLDDRPRLHALPEP